MVVLCRRQAQCDTASEPARALRFARELIAAKIRNQRTLLRRNWRSDAARREDVIERLRVLAQKTDLARDRGSLLGIEGEAASLYFQAMLNLFHRCRPVLRHLRLCATDAAATDALTSGPVSAPLLVLGTSLGH